MADAFVDIAEEVARIDLEFGGRSFSMIRGAFNDLEVAVESEDESETRLQATRLAAHCVRLLMALPGGES